MVRTIGRDRAKVAPPEGARRRRPARRGRFRPAKDGGSFRSRVFAAVFEDGADRPSTTATARNRVEILAQVAIPPAAVVVPVGNGALLGGVATTLKQHSPARGATASLRRRARDGLELGGRRPVTCDRCATFADGLGSGLLSLCPDVLVDVAERRLRSQRESSPAPSEPSPRPGSRSSRRRSRACRSCSAPGRRRPGVLVVTGRNLDDEPIGALSSIGVVSGVISRSPFF